LGLSLSPAQTTLLKSLYGLSLTSDELNFFTLCTGRPEYIPIDYPECAVIAGARSGKDSRIAAPTALYEAVFGGHEKYLAPGERAIIACVAQDRRGANILRGYIFGLINEKPWLRDLLDGEPTADEIRLTNRVSIVCFPSTMRSIRGWSIPVSIMDELAFFRWEGASDSDVEIQTSLRRGGVNFPRTKLIKISTPYLKSGVLADDYKNFYGSDSRDILIWKAPSALMNPALKADRLAREQRLDPVRFSREYEAEFSDDVDAFLNSAWIDHAISKNIYQRRYDSRFRYVSVIDQSGLRADDFALAIGHMENDIFLLDLLRVWRARTNATVDLAGIIGEIVAITKSYQCGRVIGDRSAAPWVQTKFADERFQFIESELDTTACYLAAEPFFATGKVDLLNNQDLQRELRLLERRNRPGGKVAVEHPARSHDDAAAAVCRCIANASAPKLDTSQISLVGHRLSIQDFGDDGNADGPRSSIARAWDSGRLSRGRGGWWW
jgi:hypothetical protein